MGIVRWPWKKFKYAQEVVSIVLLPLQEYLDKVPLFNGIYGIGVETINSNLAYELSSVERVIINIKIAPEIWLLHNDIVDYAKLTTQIGGTTP